MNQLQNILTERFHLPPEAWEQAMENRQEKGGQLVRILIRLNDIDEIDLLETLGSQLNMEVTRTLPPEIQTDFTASIAIAFLKKNAMVPVAILDDAYIAINDPFSFQAFDDLCAILGWNGVRPVLCPLAAITTAINFAYDMTQDSAAEVIISV